MSLINEALKKAQHQRNVTAADDAAPMPGGAPIVRRGEPQKAKNVVLLGAGAVVLVVLSVVITVSIFNRTPAAAKPAPAKPAPAVAANPAPGAAEAATAKLVTAQINLPAVAENAPAKPQFAATAPSATPVETPSASVSAKPPVARESPAVAVAPASASPAPTATVPAAPVATAPAPITPPPDAKPDERIHAFVDALRIAGVKASGTDSRVLMNDRVYRVNDIVERSLGVRLIKVEADNLTFSDANGFTYVKYF
jgi:hypothetical protein